MLSALLLLQVSTSVGDVPACKPCRIDFTHVATLGDRDGGGAINDRPAAVLVTPSGHTFVAPVRGPVQVFDARGRFVKLLGRMGRGPGEMQAASAMTLLGDTLVIFDAPLARLSLFDRSLRYVRSASLAVRRVAAAHALGDSGLVVSGLVNTPRRVGYPLHVLSTNGDIVTSWGDDTSTYLPEDSDRLERTITTGPAGSVFVAHTLAYLIEVRLASGALARTLVRSAPWFVAAKPGTSWWSQTTRTVPPASIVLAVEADSAGNLWTLIAHHKPQWRSGMIGPRRLKSGRVEWAIGDAAKVRAAVVEVIDPMAGRVITRGHPAPRFFALSGGHFVDFLSDEDGIGSVRLWRARIAGSAGPASP